MLQGSAAYKARVKFPEDKEVLNRTVLVGDMNPVVTLEQVWHIMPSYEHSLLRYMRCVI